MENTQDPQELGQDRKVSDEEAIAALLRLAGPRPGVPPERRKRVRSTVEDHWRRTVRWRRHRRLAVWVAGSLAAAAAVFITFGPRLRQIPVPFRGRVLMAARAETVTGVVHSRLLGVVKSDDLIEVGDEIRTSGDGRAAVRLDDGTSLRVDTESRLQLLDETILFLHEGAVYVDTEPSGKVTPSIEIRTPFGTLIDIGTQFEVRLRHESLRLRVREGAVDMKHGSRTYRAEPGQQLLAGADGQVVASIVPRHGEAWGWMLHVAPPFELGGKSLEAYLGWVERETGWRTRFEDPTTAAGASTLILHGSIDGLRPDETPAVVLPTCGLRHRLEDGTLTIKRLPGREGRTPASP
jgi:ferric-dicitrate binding protein FerR (iron transport regulator)